MMDKPPLVISSVSGAVLDELMVAVEKVRGPGGPRELARKTAHDSFGPVLKSLMQSTLGMFGSSPRTLFERLGGISPLMVRHIEFAFAPADGRGGTVIATFPSAPPRPSLAAWEGICEFVLDFCERTGEVAPHRAVAGGKRLEIDVRWDPRPGADA
jgi:hypothetical protein